MEHTHVAIVPSPGMGLLIPLVEFAKRLVLVRPDFHVLCIVPTIGYPTEPVQSVLASLPAAITHIYLPPVTFDSPPAAGDVLSLSMTRSAPALCQVLNSLSATTRFSTIIFDMFSSEALPSVQHFNIPPYIFFPANATNLSLSFHITKLDQMVSCEYRDLPDPVKAPGCIPIHGRDLLDLVQDRKSKTYESFLRLAKRLLLVDGIMVNTFTEMEEGAIQALQEEPGIPPVYPIGPLINYGSNDRVDGSECLQWLDEQPHGSVLFVSFGSRGALSQAQMNELAIGLEASSKRFLWVVRIPNDAAYSSDKDPLLFLPEGFLERTKERGLVMSFWAPQARVLSHDSTGGFLTHCGWNSTLEGVVNGLPLIAWPLYAEQTSNAILLSEHLNVALRLEIGQNGLVTREEIEKVVNALMEGEEGNLIRKRMEVLKDAAKKASTEEGDSAKAIGVLASKWSSHENI